MLFDVGFLTSRWAKYINNKWNQWGQRNDAPLFPRRRFVCPGPQNSASSLLFQKREIPMTFLSSSSASALDTPCAFNSSARTRASPFFARPPELIIGDKVGRPSGQ